MEKPLQSMEQQPSPERCASLKAHKSLPRKRVVSAELSDGGVGAGAGGLIAEGGREGADDPALLKASSRRSYTSPAKEAEITSWIRDASPPTPSNVTFLLPLTPPEDAMGLLRAAAQNEGTADNVEHAGKKPELTSHPSRTISGTATPVNKQSPPTPDLTPPRKQRKRSLSPALRRKNNRISLSPPPASRQASSKAESFRTAPEHSSPRLTSASVNTFHTVNGHDTPTSDKRSPRSARQPGIGLGLGLTAENLKAPTVEVPRMTLDGSPLPSSSRGASTPNMVKTDPLVAGDIPAVRALDQDDSYLEPDDQDGSSADDGLHDDNGEVPYGRHMLMEASTGHVGDHGLAESDLSSKRSISPLSDESDFDPLMAKAKRDSKRFSQISSLSIPRSVEVVVIDSSPRRKHKLRHSSKNPSLRAASSSHGGSNRSSLQSTSDVKPLLGQMLNQQMLQPTGSSLHSDSGISIAGSDHIMKRWSKIQHMEIPRRAPSATRSLPYGGGGQRFISSMYLRQGTRPATAPNGAAVNRLSPPSGQTRTFSEATTLAKEYEVSRRGRQNVPPTIPKRGSSLSAPTSRDPSAASASRSPPNKKQQQHQHQQQQQQQQGSAGAGRKHIRAASQPIPRPQIVIQTDTGPSQPRNVTSTATATLISPLLTPEAALLAKPREGSLERQQHQPPLPTTLTTDAKSSGSGSQSPRTPLWMRRSSDASDIRPLPLITTRNTTPRRSSKDDTAMMASRALLKTPFSGVSLQSSASGFYEVHEATAVNIYPHTNSSLLVIQQSPSPQISAEFPVHPAVRPGAYRITGLKNPASMQGKVARDEFVHVTINGPNGSPIVTRGDVPVYTLGSPLENPRPAPSPQKAIHETADDEVLPAVNLIPPTPLDDSAGGATAPANRTTVTSGPMSLVRRALSGRSSQPGGFARSSGLWMSSGRRNGKNSSIKKRRSRPTVADNNLSPFWRPRRFWDSDETDSGEDEGADASQASTEQRNQFYQLSKSKQNAKNNQGTMVPKDYFGTDANPVRNTLGFPQQRVIINGPASLVRRLSSIRRRRNAVQAAWADPKLNPSLRSSSPRPPTTLPLPGAGSSTNLAVGAKVPPPSSARASPSPSAMERRRRNKTGSNRRVRFEFHPMRGLSGGSGESKNWRTKGMAKRIRETRDKKRAEKEAREMERIEQRRRELRGLIGRPRMNEETAVEI